MSVDGPVRPGTLKLGDDDIRRIRRMHHNKETRKRIAAEFGISMALLQLILTKKSYAWVPEDNSYASEPDVSIGGETGEGGDGRDPAPLQGNVPRPGDGARTLFARPGLPSLSRVTPGDVLDRIRALGVAAIVPRFGEEQSLAMADVIAMHTYKRPLTVLELQALVEISVDCPLCRRQRDQTCVVVNGDVHTGEPRSPHGARINLAKRRGVL